VDAARETARADTGKVPTARRMTTCLILAAGDAARHNGGNKPLLEVNGETLLNRMWRQIKEQNPKISWLVTHRANDIGWGTVFHPVIEPKLHRWITETLLSTQDFWSDERDTVVLLGDVFYTDSAISKVFEFKGTVAFGKDCNIHALKWSPEFNGAMRDQLAKSVAETEAHPRTHGAGKLWRFVQEHGIHMVDFGDETTDFDSPQEHKRFLAKYASNR
jgi:molybdopterin-guanine dinucleotide biosynthesis protein A